MATTNSPILDRLKKGGHTLRAERGGKLLFLSDRRGLRALYETVSEHPDLFEGSEVADKVVGLAAAFILIHMRSARVCALVMSQEARRALKEAVVPHEAETLVKAIQDGPQDAAILPLEQMAREAGTPARFVEELRLRLAP